MVLILATTLLMFLSLVLVFTTLESVRLTLMLVSITMVLILATTMVAMLAIPLLVILLESVRLTLMLVSMAMVLILATTTVAMLAIPTECFWDELITISFDIFCCQKLKNKLDK